MSEGFTGMVEVGDRRYFAFSQTETEQQVIERIGREQLAAKKVLEIVNNVAGEYNVSQKSIVDELGNLIEDNKEEK